MIAKCCKLSALSLFGLAIAWGSVGRAATVYRIDINDADTPVTESGWSGLNANHTGNGGSVIVDGVTFAPFSADGARLRGSVGSPNPDALVGDFIFDDGTGEAVGLLLGGGGDLQKGIWNVDLYSNDAGAQPGNQFAAYRVNGAQTLVTNAVVPTASGPAVTYQFESDGTSAYDVFTRENSGNNRSRLNAVELTQLSSLARATNTVLQYNLDDGSSDQSATSATSQTDGVDVLATHLGANSITSGLGWGREDPTNGNNANVGNGNSAGIWHDTEDNNTWWSRGSLLPTTSPNSTQFASFTVTPDADWVLDLTDGLLGVRMGATDRDQAGNLDFNVTLRSSVDGFTSDLDLASLVVDENELDPYYVTSYFDVSSLGIVEDPLTMRLYFNVNFSGTPGDAGAMHPILDTVFLLGEIAPVPEPSTFALAALSLLSLGLVGWRRRKRA